MTVLTRSDAFGRQIQALSLVGERRMAHEAAAEASRGGHTSENAGMSSERGVRITPAESPRVPGEGSSAQG